MQFRKEKCSPELTCSNVAESIKPSAGNIFLWRSVSRYTPSIMLPGLTWYNLYPPSYISKNSPPPCLFSDSFRQLVKKTQTIHVGYNFTAIRLWVFFHVEIRIQDMPWLFLRFSKKTLRNLTKLWHAIGGRTQEIFYLEDFKCCKLKTINPLTPNDLYISRTAPLTSKRCILYTVFFDR